MLSPRLPMLTASTAVDKPMNCKLTIERLVCMLQHALSFSHGAAALAIQTSEWPLALSFCICPHVFLNSGSANCPTEWTSLLLINGACRRCRWLVWSFIACCISGEAAVSWGSVVVTRETAEVAVVWPALRLSSARGQHSSGKPSAAGERC